MALTPEEQKELSRLRELDKKKDTTSEIAKSNTVREKLAQQASTMQPGSEDTIKDKKSWIELNRKQNEGEPLSPMESFMEGIAYFTPELIGGILGGWKHGPSKARSHMKDIRASKRREEITPYQQRSLEMQQKRLDQRREAEEGLDTRSNKRFEYRKQRNIAEQKRKEAAHDRGVHQLNIMEEILNRRKDDFTGRFDAVMQMGKQVIGDQDPDFTDFQQAVTDFGSQYIKEISGAQVSDAERKRLDEALPSKWAQENVNLRRVQNIRKLMDAIKQRNDEIKARLGGTLPKGKKIKDYITKENAIDVKGIMEGKVKVPKSKPKFKDPLLNKYL